MNPTQQHIISRSNTALEYISLSRAKDHLRELTTDNDSFITNAIKIGFAIAESYIGQPIIKSTVDYFYPSTKGKLFVPCHVIGTLSSYYFNDSGVEVLAAYYETTAQIKGINGTYVSLQSLQSGTNGHLKYKVRAVAGWNIAGTSGVDEATIIPEDIIQAVLLLVADIEQQRINQIIGVSSSMAYISAYSLLDKYKINVFI